MGRPCGRATRPMGNATMRVIAGDAHGRRLTAPRGLATRPATARVRQSIFSRLAARMEISGAAVLDLFAGSGSLGIEALSRGARHVVFVDSSRPAAAAIGRNLERLGLGDRAAVIVAAAARALERLAARGARFDLVFVDAPYARDSSAQVLALLVDLGLLKELGWAVVRQAGRAAELSAQGLERIRIATVGDHRIALYRRPPPG